jgi:hypothetical protein
MGRFFFVQTANIDYRYRLPTKEKQTSVFRYFHFPYIYMLSFQTKTGAQAIFLNPFTAFSSCKRKFVVFPFVNPFTNGNYPFVNGLNGLNKLNRLVYLCLFSSRTIFFPGQLVEKR